MAAAPSRALEHRTEHFTILYPEARAETANAIHDRAERVLGEVARQLGVADRVMEPIVVRILESREALAEAMPESAVTEWAAGVAFPKSSLILLLADHDTHFELFDVFRHEVSHIVLARAVDHVRLPLWFVEGIAVHQAGEQILERWRTMANASLTDSVPPLSQIARGFPAHEPHLVDLAYAQSTSFLSYLIREHGWPRIRAVLARVRNGIPFRRSFESIFGGSVETLEGRWKLALAQSASWIPVLTDTALLWMIAFVLFLFAYFVIRDRNKRRMDRMGDPFNDDEFA